ncbi:MAG: hypothetical protein PHT95_02320 [Candidatus Omnitrophica bacterium]|nr:hypothetical protein [Candidatus Omnitrophota bacterium]MDD4013069.1 hypothetical protein [Candidatus Omnitrophota bacterium]
MENIAVIIIVFGSAVWLVVRSLGVFSGIDKGCSCEVCVNKMCKNEQREQYEKK